ncbi:Glycerol kinase [Thalassocella blandensis]|nr:Glycerol kinase [Thalassocella blandensis]
MSSTPAILAIDQGTTSSRAIVFDTASRIITVAQEEFPQHYPADGWVEHAPEDIWQSTLRVSQQAIKQAQSEGFEIVTIGITNQRETTLAWQRSTGKAIGNAIVWQDRRTADYCATLKSQGHETMVSAKTGLLLDPYFSASKMRWILDNYPEAQQLADQGDLAFGTVDSFLLWRLTDGKSFFTDATNASRTNLFNIETQCWDTELLTLFGIPAATLPEVKDSAAEFGTTSQAVLGHSIPIQGIAGDQQAATVGQCCFHPGDIKSTYGTGCFVVMNTGEELIRSQHRLLSTVAYRLQGKPCYALEGSIFVAGAAVQWLRDSLHLIQNAAETETHAASLTSNDGVFLVPAFTGLGAPYWNPNARGAIFGLTRASTPAHLSRATLEAVCYQTFDLLEAMANDGVSPKQIRIDGAMVNNNWLMQFLADILAIDVHRPQITETTALGAAFLAGLQAGIYADTTQLEERWQQQAQRQPQMDEELRQALIRRWQKAVDQTLNFSA